MFELGNKKLLTFILAPVVLFFVYATVGIFARNNFLDVLEPFPTWTYASEKPFLNVFTSWDSGFYYDIATNGYPRLDAKVNTAYIEIPRDSWVKVFLGGGLIGEDKFALPFSKPFESVNNVVFLLGKREETVSVPIYNAYEGIGYCIYKGPIDFERDVKVANESLTNPGACGSSSCNMSYVTYYDGYSQNVVFQEVFKKADPDSVVSILGTDRPQGMGDIPYQGLGCKTVKDFDLVKKAQIDYETQFTVYPFMPLYPHLSKLLGFVVGDIIFGGLLLSYLAFVGSLVFLYKLLALYFEDNTSYYATLAFMLLPVSFYNFAFLPVSLFNLLAFAALYFGKRKRVLLTSFVTVLAVYTSLLGIFLLIPLFQIFRKEIKNFLYVFGTLIVGVMFYAYAMFERTGDWLVLVNSRKPWYGDGETFVGGLLNYFVHFDKYVAFELIIFLLLIFMSYIALRLIKQNYKSLGDFTTVREMRSVATIFMVIALVNGGLTGMFKYVGLLIPTFVLLALSREKSTVLFVIMLLLSLLFSLLLFSLWTISSRFVV